MSSGSEVRVHSTFSVPFLSYMKTIKNPIWRANLKIHEECPGLTALPLLLSSLLPPSWLPARSPHLGPEMEFGQIDIKYFETVRSDTFSVLEEKVRKRLGELSLRRRLRKRVGPIARRHATCSTHFPSSTYLLLKCFLLLKYVQQVIVWITQVLVTWFTVVLSKNVALFSRVYLDIMIF